MRWLRLSWRLPRSSLSKCSSCYLFDGFSVGDLRFVAKGGPLELGFRTAIGGAAAGRALAEAIGAELLPEEMNAAAEELVATV